MSNKITSDGINTTIEYNGVREVISDGNYSAETSNVRKTHSNSGIQETGTQKNIDIRGNSQETCYTRGVTCEADIKIVGNPDQFDGKNYRKLKQMFYDGRFMVHHISYNINVKKITNLKEF